MTAVPVDGIGPRRHRQTGTSPIVYTLVTRDIQVSVEPRFVVEESTPEKGRYFWAYTVEIANFGAQAVQLRSRYWHITDGLGRVEEVSGAGVVGEEPILAPGESFEYTSGCPLQTPSGIMQGAYHMESEDGEFFSVEIPAFSLDLPDTPRVLN